MADLLFVSLEVRSLCFTCFRKPYVRRRITSKSSNRNGISTPKPQYSTHLMLSSSISPHCSSSSSSDDATGDFDIVSTTEHSDGSILFRFGNVNEMKKNVEVEESTVTHGGAVEDRIVASGDLLKVVIENDDLVEAPDGDHELEIVDEELDHTLQGEVECHHKREKRSDLAEIVDPVNERSVHKNDDIAFDSHSDVVKTNVDSIQKDKKQILSPVSVSEHHDGIEVENSEASEVNGEHSSKNHVVISITASKLDLASDGEKVSDSLEVSQKNSESEIKTRLASSGRGFKIEVQNNCASQEGTEENTDIKVMHLSSTAKDHNVETLANCMTDEDVDKNNLIEVMPTSTLSEAEPILNDETTHGMVAKSGNIKRTDCSKMSNDYVPSSTWEEKLIDGDVEISDIAQVSDSVATELQMIETTSKREEISTKGFFLSSGAALLQHPSKVLAGGEDAYFVFCQNWLGVADGVGQWSMEGINDGLYAQELLNSCQKIVSDCKSIPVTDPVEVLNRSAAETHSPGASTVLVAYFDDQALHVANIGDTGFIIIRTGTVLKRSSPMIHEFSFPLRLQRGDEPSEFVEVYHIDLDEGDVIITATDGLFDNLYNQEIASIVSRSLQEGLKTQEIAELLAMTAQEVGSSSSARSPFADEAQAAGYVGYRGGKLDDVTVIVSLVHRRP